MTNYLKLTYVSLAISLATSVSFGELIIEDESAPDSGTDFPLLSFAPGNFGTYSYDEATNVFTFTADPTSYQKSATDPASFIFPESISLIKEVVVSIEVDENGNLIGGAPGIDDIVVIGAIDRNDNPFDGYEARGVLLSGEILDFGFFDGEGPNTDLFDFCFKITGGLLLEDYVNDIDGICNGLIKNLYVRLRPEDSDFAGDFNVSFGGVSKGIILCKDVKEDEKDPICVVEYDKWGHAFWLPGIGKDFVFEDGKGNLEYTDDGNLILTGTIFSRSNPLYAFDVNIQFSDFSDEAPDGSPKLELPSSQYVPDGPVDPSTWDYYETVSGTLTGLDALYGAEIEITRSGPAFQIGMGANGKNIGLGASTWFNYTTTVQPIHYCYHLPETGHGDINVNIVDCPPEGDADASICVVTYEDLNGNREFDDNENPIGRVRVYLRTPWGKRSKFRTGLDGAFTRGSLLPGKYEIEVPSWAAGLRAYDDDKWVTLYSGQKKTVYIPYRDTSYCVKGVLFYDDDRSGKCKWFKPRFKREKVILIDQWGKKKTTWTDRYGRFCFSHLKKGEYKVRVPSKCLDIPRSGPTEKKAYISWYNRKAYFEIDYKN